MTRFRTHAASGGDHGAIAIFVAILCIVLFGAAALAVDIGSKVVKKQQLGNTMDAAALAGAVSLPDMLAARAAGGVSLAANDPAAYSSCKNTPSGASCPQPVFYCMVPPIGTAPNFTPDLSQIAKPLGTSTLPAACKVGPLSALGTQGGTGPYTWSCTSSLCRITMDSASATNLAGCDQLATPTCANASAMVIAGSQTVPFGFAGVLGKTSGNTGTVRAVACGTYCGGVASGPVDIVLIADRSGSMFSADPTTPTPTDVYATSEGKAIVAALTDLKDGALVHIAMGTVGITDESTPVCTPGATIKASGTSPVIGNMVPNSWIPVGFDSTYVTGGLFNATTSPVGVAATCLSKSSTSVSVARSGTGSWMASPIKLASDALLGGVTLNSPSLALQSGSNKAIIFETDEQPNETGSSSCASNPTSCVVGGTGDHKTIGNSNGTTACKNFQTVADNAKAKNIAIAVVTYNPGSGQNCQSLLGLSHDPAASKDSAGNYLVYAPTSASELADAFRAAIAAVRGQPHLINLP